MFTLSLAYFSYAEAFSHKVHPIYVRSRAAGKKEYSVIVKFLQRFAVQTLLTGGMLSVLLASAVAVRAQPSGEMQVRRDLAAMTRDHAANDIGGFMAFFADNCTIDVAVGTLTKQQMFDLFTSNTEMGIQFSDTRAPYTILNITHHGADIVTRVRIDTPTRTSKTGILIVHSVSVYDYTWRQIHGTWRIIRGDLST